MIKKHQSHIVATIGTLVSMFLILLLLYFLHMTYIKPVEDEGITISFGYMEEESDAKKNKVEPQAKKATSKPSPARSSKNDYMTQDDDEALAMKKQNKDSKKQDEDEEEERKKREDEAKQKADLFAKNFAGSENDPSGNDSDKDGSNPKKGNPVGKGSGSMGGSKWQLSGRDCRSLPKPENTHNQAGKVVVNITVDTNGNVTGVSLGERSTISDRATVQLALNAAWKAKFTPGDRPQRGTITYIFNLN